MKTIALLTIIRYRGVAVPFGLTSMLLFRVPLFFRKGILFWRLMGSGKNGTFDKIPDLNQWGILGVFPYEFLAEKKGGYSRNMLEKSFGRFIATWIRIFGYEYHSYLLEPIEGHGTWNGQPVFGILPRNSDYEGEIAVMTRATIRLKKLGRFWQHVPDAAREMALADGFIKSYGLGEWPWIKQATFSLWNKKECMRNFAYRSQYHKEIIRKTHEEKWYSEEMFVRFKVLDKF